METKNFIYCDSRVCEGEKRFCEEWVDEDGDLIAKCECCGSEYILAEEG